MVAAHIKRGERGLAFVFEFLNAEHHATDRVTIDAVTGLVTSVEYSVERNSGGTFTIVGPAVLMALVESSYEIARNSVDEAADNCHIVSCILRVERARKVYVFDVEIGEEHQQRQMLIDANTGILISTLPPS